MSGKWIAKCPSCDALVHLRREATRFLASMEAVPPLHSAEGLIEGACTGHYADAHSDRRRLHWACDECLELGRAIEAKPSLQTFCDCPPYFAYFDEQRHCRTCSAPFVFRAEEQWFWYEQLRFFVQSRPVECVDCRRARREHKRQRWLKGVD